LAPGVGEIIGGNQREERLDVLDRSMAQRGIDREYYGPTPSSPASGGGLGRGCPATARCPTPASASPRLFAGGTLAYVTGHANVRDAIPFPRTPGNARY
jgi:asparaginyl-tRNA synthetase